MTNATIIYKDTFLVPGIKVMGDPFYSSDPFRKKTRLPLGGVTVMIRYKSGRVVAQNGITSPWPYMASLRKQPDVATVWIDDNLPPAE